MSNLVRRRCGGRGRGRPSAQAHANCRHVGHVAGDLGAMDRPHDTDVLPFVMHELYLPTDANYCQLRK